MIVLRKESSFPRKGNHDSVYNGGNLIFFLEGNQSSIEHRKILTST